MNGRTCCEFVWVSLELFKYIISTLVTVFYCSVVFHGIAKDLNVADFGGPIPEFLIFTLCIILLAVNEGFQVGVLNSQSMSAIFIRDEGYERAARVHEVMFGVPGNWVTGNLKRLLVGQSFMVVFLSFTLAQLTTFPDYPNIFNMNSHLFNMLFCSGLPGVVITVVIGQLTPSLLAKEYPIGFLNLPGIYHIILVALYVEKSGISHFVYVLYGICNTLFFKEKEKDEEGEGMEEGGAIAKTKSTDTFVVPSLSDMEAYRGMNVGITMSANGSVDLNSVSDGKSESTGNSEGVSSVTLTSASSVVKVPSDSKLGWHNDEPDSAPNTPKKSEFVTAMPSLNRKNEVLSCCNTTILYLKYVLSTIFTLVCFAFLIYGLAMRYSLINLTLPLQLLLLFLSMVVIVYCEGMKVSIVSTTHIDSEEMKETHKTAYHVHKLLNVDTSEGVKKFLLGRQMLVVSLGFFIASLTHFAGLKEHVPYAIYFMVVTAALPGVMVFLEVAQLTPQLLAEQNNIAFINLPGSYYLAKFLLFVEACGIMNVAWLIYYGLDNCLCSKPRRIAEEYDELDTTANGNLFTLCYDSDSSDPSASNSIEDTRAVLKMSKIRRNPLLANGRGMEC
mmetsp:Transcript_15054/g.24932  ORF Transcript_15054/g.24932 Transcript_15054/m.24932 type:complete len:614 (-) Transcript_15054:270-2111(-)